MGSFAVLALLAGLMLPQLFGGDDDDDNEVEAVEDDETTVDEPTVDEPDPELDLGASLIENEDGSVHLELGEDETGSLLALKFEKTSDNGDADRVFSLGLYLLPEGVEFPIDPTGGALDFSSIGGMISELGLEELGRFDLGTLPYVFASEDGGGPDTRVEPPVITSDDPIEIVRVRYDVEEYYYFRSEPDETFSPFEEPGFYINGVEGIDTEEDFVGTDEDDVILARATSGTPGVTIEGLGGDDFILTEIANSRLEGGDGDDSIWSLGEGSELFGGAGDDDVTITGGGVGHGGDGDDTLSGTGNGLGFGLNGHVFETEASSLDAETEMFGGEGNDRLTLWSETVTGSGGNGDDIFNLRDGASAFGDAGDDRFNVNTFSQGAGITANGGEGDDRFVLYGGQGDLTSAMTLTGGVGADVYEFTLDAATETGPEQFAEITDFDPSEDVLYIDGGSDLEVSVLRSEESADGLYTDVIAEFTRPSGATAGTAVIRLAGVSGFTAEQLVA